VSRLFFLAGLSLWNLRREKAQGRRRRAGPARLRHRAGLQRGEGDAKTVERLLASDHGDLEVIVVDDGSQDRTADVLKAAFGQDPRVRIITKANGGKAAAVNAGWRSRPVRSSSRSTPTRSSSTTPSPAWCAGSPTRRSAQWPVTPRSATAPT